VEWLRQLLETWAEFRDSDEGQGLVEYALIIALVAILLVGALMALNGQLGNVFTNIGNSL
jgi:pilus assembly protein Flp/PilA